MGQNNLPAIQQAWCNLRIGARLTIGVTIILLLTLTVGLVGWFTLESQARSQIQANQAIDLVSALRAARQDEKNYMLSGDPRHIKETLQAIEEIRDNAKRLQTVLSTTKRQTISHLLTEQDTYQREFENFVLLNTSKEKSLKEMVSQGRRLKDTAVLLVDDQKKELQRLETLAVTSSEERLEKSKKADDANRMIKLMGEARQQEKNFLLRGDYRYCDETLNLVDILIVQAKGTRKSFSDKENQELAQQIIQAAEQYLLELKKVIIGKRKNDLALNTMIALGRAVEEYAIKLRQDQKQELLKLEEQSGQTITQRLDKRTKVESANRIIQLMNEARQQEKNFLLRKDSSYANLSRSLVTDMIQEASTLRKRFQDRQNQVLASQIIEAAIQYLKEFEKVVAISDANRIAQDGMASLGRRVEDRAAQLRGDQKLELQRLERLSTRASKQRLDKRIKADAANQIIQLMGEARQQEKNFLLRKEYAYAEVTRTMVGHVIRQALLLRERFNNKQNRDLSDRIIGSANTYLTEFEDVVISEREQLQQQRRMVKAARQIEFLAGNIRTATQLQANIARKTAVIVILVTLGMALLFGISVAVILTRSIASPIRELIVVINRLAQEDDVKVPMVSNQDEIGQIARAISNFKEVILQRKEKTEAQLIQAEKMAALGDLVAGVAHEINTPIGIAVTGNTHLQDQIVRLEKDFTEGSLKKFDFRAFVDNALPTVATIQRNLERASGLIKSFKQVAVDQSSQEVRHFKLLDYIDEILISLQPKLKQTPHQITVSGNQQLSVETVPGALSQIITNLVMNSLTHAYNPNSPAGTIKIQVSTIDDKVILLYSDDGKGMEKKIIHRIYEPFFTTQRGSGGSGLGLSIIFNLVTQTLSGRIQCQSQKGIGTKFEITFPMKKLSQV